MRIGPGHVAVVTGAGSGIGAALCRAFAAQGCSVVAADIDGDSAKAVADSIGTNALAMRTDVRDARQIDELARAAMARFGRVDILCNNAGMAPPPALFEDHAPDIWRLIMEVTLLSAVHGVRAFLPHMKAQGAGHIVNSASLAGMFPIPLVAPYCAAKAALISMSESLADELSRTHPEIKVSVLCPGLVTSKLSETSARNMPAQSAPTGASLPATEFDLLIARSGHEMSADDLAVLTLQAIMRDATHIYSHGDLHHHIRAQIFG
ncbi:MAG: SDR family oxidoreductase [Caulobacterales bacterium]